MYEIQHYSRILRPGRAEDGPPYPKSGDWHVLVRHETARDVIAGVERLMFPIGDRPRDASEYRVVRTDSLGRVIGMAALSDSDKRFERAFFRAAVEQIAGPVTLKIAA